jgi:hypothetical protein
MDRQECLSHRTRYPHDFLSAKLAAIRHIAARLHPHFRKIGDNALLLTDMRNVFAVMRYKKGGATGQVFGSGKSEMSKPLRRRISESSNVLQGGFDLLNWRCFLQ